MSKITIINFPENILQCLQMRANLHRRSLSDEITAILEEYFNRLDRKAEELITSADASKNRMSFHITLDEIQTAIRSGRK